MAYTRTRYRKEVNRPVTETGTLGDPLSDDQLLGIIHQNIDDALNRADGDLTQVRADLYKRYKGDLYGNERRGFSRYTTQEVFEAVEWLLPDVLEVFTGGDRAVVFQPTSADDKPVAEQETDVVNYRIEQANEGYGFLAIHDFCKDGLLNPTAYAKAYAEMDTRERTHKLQGVLDTDVQELLDDETIELVSRESEFVTIEMPDPQTGQPVPQQIEVFNIEYIQKEENVLLKIESVPGEEVLVDHQCRTLNLDDANFVAHKSLRTYTDLVDAGYDLTDVPKSPTSDDESSEVEKYTRYFFEDEDDQAHDTPSTTDPTMFRYMCYECYLYADVEGNKRASLWRVMVINGTIIEKEKTDFQPFVAMSAIIQPHKHVGMSAAQAVESMQKLHTELVRQLLDNIRTVNTKRKIMSADALMPDGKTMDAMLDTTAEWVVVDGPAREAMSPEPQTSIVQEMLPVLGYFDQKTALRSGVTMENDLDPSAMQNVKATNYIGAMDKAGRRIGAIIKCFAETGIKQLYMKVHQLSRKYINIKETIELRGQWVEIDPSEWKERKRMKVTVGLGHNTHQQRLNMVMNLFQTQMQAQGMNLADYQGVYNTLVKLVEVSGLGAADQFFVNPGTPGWQPPQPPPDPAMMLAQSRSMLEQAQAQVVPQEQQSKMMETQTKAQEMMARLSQEEQAQIAEMQKTLEQVNEIRAQTETEKMDVELIIAQTIKTLAEANEAKAKAAALRRQPAEGESQSK